MALLGIVLGLMAMDLGVQGGFVAYQARIFAIDPRARSRMSGQLFLSAYLGAAVCSAVTSANWSGWGWNDTCAFALLLVVLAVLIEHSSWGPRRLQREMRQPALAVPAVAPLGHGLDLQQFSHLIEVEGQERIPVGSKQRLTGLGHADAERHHLHQIDL